MPALAEKHPTIVRPSMSVWNRIDGKSIVAGYFRPRRRHDYEFAIHRFRNQGEFIAALHVSKNLDIPFDQLKAKVTGEHAMSLGKAIHELRPNLTEKQVKTEEEKAEKQAKETEKPKTKPIT